MPVLKYKNPADGSYVPLGPIEEVTVSASPPPVNTDLWVDLQDNSGGMPVSGRNVIRNGDMSIAQRGNGPSTAVYYLVDGFKGWYGGGTVTTSRVAQAIGLGSPFLRTVIASQSGAGDNCQIGIPIEDAATLSGKQATLSFDAVAASGNPKIFVEALQNGSGTVITPFGAVTISTTKARYSLTFTIPTLTGTVSGSTTNMVLNLWLSAGATHASRAPIGIQNNTFDITDVQLEEGAMATSFERIPVQQQLAWCQRYFVRLGGQNPNMTWQNGMARFGAGNFSAATQGFAHILFPVLMRSAPSCANSAVANFAAGDYASNLTCTGMGYQEMTSHGVLNSMTIASGGTPGRPLWLTGFNGNAYLDFSAEF